MKRPCCQVLDSASTHYSHKVACSSSAAIRSNTFEAEPSTTPLPPTIWCRYRYSYRYRNRCTRTRRYTDRLLLEPVLLDAAARRNQTLPSSAYICWLPAPLALLHLYSPTPSFSSCLCCPSLPLWRLATQHKLTRLPRGNDAPLRVSGIGPRSRRCPADRQLGEALSR